MVSSLYHKKVLQLACLSFISLVLWLHRAQGRLDVSFDTTSISLGWDIKNERICSLRFDMTDKEHETMFGDVNKIIPCWPLGENSKTIAFLEFNKETGAFLSVCLKNDRGINIVLVRC